MWVNLDCIDELIMANSSGPTFSVYFAILKQLLFFKFHSGLCRDCLIKLYTSISFALYNYSGRNIVEFPLEVDQAALKVIQLAAAISTQNIKRIPCNKYVM